MSGETRQMDLEMISCMKSLELKQLQERRAKFNQGVRTLQQSQWLQSWSVLHHAEGTESRCIFKAEHD